MSEQIRCPKDRKKGEVPLVIVNGCCDLGWTARLFIVALTTIIVLSLFKINQSTEIESKMNTTLHINFTVPPLLLKKFNNHFINVTLSVESPLWESKKMTPLSSKVRHHFSITQTDSPSTEQFWGRLSIQVQNMAISGIICLDSACLSIQYSQEDKMDIAVINVPFVSEEMSSPNSHVMSVREVDDENKDICKSRELLEIPLSIVFDVSAVSALKKMGEIDFISFSEELVHVINGILQSVNMRLSLVSVRIIPHSAETEWSRPLNSCLSPRKTLSLLSAWRGCCADDEHSGIVHLISDCFSNPPGGGIVGMANLGSVCIQKSLWCPENHCQQTRCPSLGEMHDDNWLSGTSFSTIGNVHFPSWMRFAHEIIHVLGGRHTNEGLMVTHPTSTGGGGILSEESRNEVCQYIDDLYKGGTSFGSMCLLSVGPECGNGIVDQGEECEIKVDSSACCSVDCLWHVDIACPHDSTSPCCTNCEFAPLGKLCDRNSYCSLGACVSDDSCALSFSLSSVSSSRSMSFISIYAGREKSASCRLLCTVPFPPFAITVQGAIFPDGTPCGNIGDDKVCERGECLVNKCPEVSIALSIVSSSNPFEQRQALNAVDGNIASWWQAGSSRNEWLLLESIESYIVSRVRLVIKDTRLQDAIFGYVVNGVLIKCAHFSFPATPNAASTLLCQESSLSRLWKLEIKQTHQGWVGIRELTLYGSASLCEFQKTEACTGRWLNFSVSKASSEPFAPVRTSKLAIDGSYETWWQAGSSSNEWLLLDAKVVVTVSYALVLAKEQRLRYAKFFFLSRDGKGPEELGCSPTETPSSQHNAILNFSCISGSTGQFWRFVALSTFHGWVGVREIHLFGHISSNCPSYNSWSLDEKFESNPIVGEDFGNPPV